MTVKQVCYDCLLNSYFSILFIKIKLDSQYYITDGKSRIPKPNSFGHFTPSNLMLLSISDQSCYSLSD